MMPRQLAIFVHAVLSDQEKKVVTLWPFDKFVYYLVVRIYQVVFLRGCDEMKLMRLNWHLFHVITEMGGIVEL